MPNMYPDLPFLVIIGKSTDINVVIAMEKEYRKLHPMITIVTQNQSDQRELIIDEVPAEYCTVISDKGIPMPTRISNAAVIHFYTAIKKDPELLNLSQLIIGRIKFMPPVNVIRETVESFEDFESKMEDRYEDNEDLL